MMRRLTWIGFAGSVLFFLTTAAESADSLTLYPETQGLTMSCVGLSGPRTVVKAAFDYRAVRAVQHLDEYVAQLSSHADAWQQDPTKVAKVCRLYALDELADIYTTQLVQFDLADQRNTEAEALLKELNCCKASYYFTGTFYPSNRLVFSFIFTPGVASGKGYLSEASMFPDSFLAEVAARDIERIRQRIHDRKILLDSILKRTRSQDSDRVTNEGTVAIATKELDLWKTTLQMEPSLSESAKAVLIHDRIWSLRWHMDEATWRSLVIESGKAALVGAQVADTTSPRVGALLRFRLGYAYMRAGQIEEGARMYDDMLRKVALYQKELEDNYSKVQWAQTKDKMASGAKAAASFALTGISFAIEGAGAVVQVGSGFLGPAALAGAGANLGTSYAAMALRSMLPGLARDTALSIVNSANPGVEKSLQELQYARLKSLETARLFGETARALPLILNEHERLDLHRDLGKAFEHQKQFRLAIDQYKNAIEIIEHERAGLGKEGTRLAFLEGKEQVYGRVIHLLVEAGDTTEAFEYAERARSRNFVDVLASGTPKFRTSKESAAFNQRQREQAEVELTVQRSGLTRIEIEELRRSTRGIQLVADSASSAGADGQSQPATPSSLTVEFDSLTAVNTASTKEITAQLGRQAAMLGFYVGESHTVVFLLQDGNVSAWLRPVGRAALQSQVEVFRQLIQQHPKRTGAELSAIHQAGQDLLRGILQEPLAAVRKPVLYVSPHGPLHYLPFAAVHDGSSYLADRFTLITVPSGTVLTYLGKKGRTSTDSTVVLANPDLGNSAYDLPFAEQEGDAVKNRRPSATLLKRKDAQEIKIRELGPKASVLHFATHGKFNAARPLDSALLLAPGGGEDGILTAGEIFGLGLPGNLVVLSACETGLGQLATGDEILGLTRAFMYAGAPQLIATLWEIDDQATSELMDQLYAHLGKESAPVALRTAQLNVRTRYPHPYYWAGFVAHGMQE
ncbi:MAG: CHAT domain-containing protein [Nitrospira sp.]|nr:CHAT domain-containing protein [Nitrospira sp.]